MRMLRRIDAAVGGELLLLAVAAPLLYFPARFPVWMPAVAVLVLALGFAWRRRCIGMWYSRTPLDAPLALLLLVLLPIAVFAAPAPLRDHYSLPRAGILLWNFCLFCTVSAHATRSHSTGNALLGLFVALGVMVAVAAVLGTQWVSKWPALGWLLGQLPRPFVGVFEGAEDGFSPNQVAGALLYVLPLALALTASALARRKAIAVAGGLAVAFMGLVFVATQSRAGFAGLAVALLLLLLLPHAWGRWLLLAGAVAAIGALLFLPVGAFLLRLDAGTRADVADSGINMAGRFEIWGSALNGIGDFFFTGMGLGAFRAVAPHLYPLSSIPPTYDIAHAHNFFLQAALDFGVPGLIVVLSIYLIAIVAAAALWRAHAFAGSTALAIGFLATLIGQAVYSLADAVTMGSKPNFLLWFLLALMVGAAQWARPTPNSGPAASPPAASSPGSGG